jgi:hypothetical protein
VKYAGCILVRDASGYDYQVHEYRSRRFLKRRSRFALDTGEAVERLDADTFVVSATGERLTRADK